MRRPLTHAVLTAALSVTLGATLALPAHAGYKPPSTQTEWLPAAADADIERAFARARAENKPVLLYWGAQWCPPCNQLKATLFNRQDFIERSKSFVAVHVDGDLPGAQRLGSRFKVRGYPTVILFNPAGQEITRLPGEVDAPKVMGVLQLGLAGGRPAKAVLADARAGKPMNGNEWRLLAYYSWETDEQQLVAPADRAALLAQLAAAAPDTDLSTRLWLKALAESDETRGIKADDALRQRVRRVLGSPEQSRLHLDVIVNQARAIARHLDAERDRVAYDAALARLQADASLSRADRMSALLARVNLARLDQGETLNPKLPAPLVKAVRAQVSRDDREITDGYERQAVITEAAHLLGRAGLWTESDALLEANLAKSHSPYYLMSMLGGNAKKRGDASRALQWYEKAFERSEGPATQLQWGAAYLTNLVELAPDDAARIERTASRLFAKAADDQGAFHERSARSLQRVGRQLVQWNQGGRHDAAMQRLQAQLDGVCGQVDAADRATCQNLLKKGS